MMWQDFVFMLGSSLSIVFLAPTLRDATSRVPLGTSVPSMAIGGAYAFTFATMGMTFSAAGAFASGTMWALIATFRSPGALSGTNTRREAIRLLASDVGRAVDRLRGSNSIADQFAFAEEGDVHPVADRRDARPVAERRDAADAHAASD